MPMQEVTAKKTNGWKKIRECGKLLLTEKSFHQKERIYLSC